jgi:hypothetical protein
VPKKNNPAKTPGKKIAEKVAAAPKEVRLAPAVPKPIVVKHLEHPPKFANKKKKIHPRHVLPLIREGLERQFHSTSPQAAFFRSSALAPLASTDELALVTNTELTGPAQQQVASNVGEPSVAVNGNVVFYTGNWYAAVSSDGGTTFQYINPASEFPDPGPGSQFCCDQVVHYIGDIDTFVWLLQYGPDTGDNIQRLAFAKTADVVNGRWRLFDITTKALNVAGAFMDFPDLAVGANNLYVTTNIFAADNTVGSAVIRIPFAGIQSGQVMAQPFVSMNLNLQSFRVAQNCGKTAFFAAHQDTSTLAVFSWDEGRSTPVQTSVGVARWIGGNGYVSRTPDGRRWLDRADPRITGATLANTELWFAWSVDSGSNRRPNPFVQIARIDASNLTLLDNINIFDPDSATCYGALSTNVNGEVGVSYMLGGGSREPSHVVGILTGNRKDLVVATGDRGPLDPDTGKGEWGDYLTIRRHSPTQALFAATGYTMKGPGDGSNRDVTPRFVVFGRAGDTGGPGLAVVPGDGGTVGDGTGAEAAAAAGAPFKDVNTLPTVSAQVAAAIKAAAMAEGQLAMAAGQVLLRLVTKPGIERWPVKTGTDQDVALVGKNIIGGHSLGAGIVDATVEELIRIPRPPDMTPPSSDFPNYQGRRRGPVEMTVWRIEATVIALKQEQDGDYHLVLQGASGQTMVAEVPTPRPPFVDASSPWTANMVVARKAVDDKLVSHLSPADFIPLDGTLVPRESLPAAVQPQSLAMPSLPESFVTPQEGDIKLVPTFKTQVTPTPVRITGVGFFDKVHGQMGVSLLNGIELHPILKIEWI